MINRPEYDKNNGMMVVTDQNDCMIRYFLISKNLQPFPNSPAQSNSNWGATNGFPTTEGERLQHFYSSQIKSIAKQNRVMK